MVFPPASLWPNSGEWKACGFLSLLRLVIPTQECPSGIVNEENFKQIYSQFFPQGGKETDTQGAVAVHP